MRDLYKYSLMSDEVLFSGLKTSNIGLTSSEAKKRLISEGPNKLTRKKKFQFLKHFLKQFKNSIIYLLLAAALISYVLKNYNDAIVISIILIINTGLSFFQEFKSENALDKLQKLVSREILVKRDGKEILVPEECLVFGDYVILREGDIVPADIKLIEVNELSVNESQLTGESLPIIKTTEGKESIAYAGSTVEDGEGIGIVCLVGLDTKIGSIAKLSSETKRETQYEKSLKYFSSFLMKITIITLIIVFIAKLIISHHYSSIGSLALFMVALSITVIPEAMPVIATITLSRGAMNLSKKHVIAKTLSAVEDLGDINILCSDKTGTLTQNKMTIKELFAKDENLFNKLAIASLETLDEKRKKFQSSFDRAFIEFVPDDIKAESNSFSRISELPFDPKERRRRVVFNDGKVTYLVSIGSVETLVELCDVKDKDRIQKIINKDGKKGLRHIGIAYKIISNHSINSKEIPKLERSMTFSGFVSLEDPLRHNTINVIALARQLGVSIKILSGDSREVTQYVANEVGLIGSHDIVYEGREIDNMSDEKLTQIVQLNHVFARLTPEQKYRIIKLLKLNGNIVGYQGDGINDAPALKLADVAIAVSNATDVAQESADILLLRSDLGVIINGIKDGRKIFTNINKYIRYTMISNFGNFFALSILFLLSVSTLPLLPLQLLLTSLITDFPLLTIATDNVDDEDLLKPSKFNTHILMFISIFLGSITAIFEILFFALIRNNNSLITQTSLYLFLTVLSLSVIVSVRNKDHFWKAPKLSATMKASFLLVAIFSIGIIYIPFFQKLFNFSLISETIIIEIISSTILFVFILDIVKVIFYKSKISLID